MNCKRLIASAVAGAIILLYNGTAHASVGDNEKRPKASARSAVVMEQSSRRVLFEKNARERLPMASTTKIMTALVALEHGRLTDTVTVSPDAAGVPGSSIYLKAGEQLTLEQLLYGLMLQSGNDAATAIAQFVGGSREGFLELMNAEAARIGARDTHFTSVCGLDTPGHYTTAYDLALITAAAMDNADFRRIVSTKAINIPYEGLENGRYLKNKNKTLWNFEGADGVKTGYTGDAGRCFVGSATRGGMQLIAVVLNCGPMFEESSALMDESFGQYALVPVAQSRAAIGSLPDGEGILGSVRYGSQQDIVLPLNSDERERIYTDIRIMKQAEAPVRAGQILGVGHVMLDGAELASYPVVALEPDGRRTFGWYVKQIVGGYLWRTEREAPGFKNIWQNVGSLRAASARN